MKSSTTAQGNIVEVSFFDKRFDHLWEKIKEDFPICVWKDSEYLNWRYIVRPNAKYQVLAIEDGDAVYGFVVLRRVDSKYCTGHIVDLQVLPEKKDYASVLIASAVNCLREGGAEIATCQMYEHDTRYHLLTDSGFLHRGQSGVWMVVKLSEDLTRDVQDGRNWFVTNGDSDGV